MRPKMQQNLFNTKIPHSIHLAPMDDVTDIAFRKTIVDSTKIKLYTYSEMTASERIIANFKGTEEKIQRYEKEKRYSIQIFSGSGENLKKAISILDKKADFDYINLNFGCPSKKIIKNKAGAYWLKYPEKIVKLTKEISKEFDRLTIKVRLGMNEVNTDYLKNVKAKIIVVHGRTAKQGYSGKADWNEIMKIKEKVKEEVVGNGDIFSAETALNKLKKISIMIGRGVLINPLIFKEIQGKLNEEDSKMKENIDVKERNNLESKNEQKLKTEERIRLFRKYIENCKEFNTQFGKVKKNSMFFVKGLKNNKWIKEKIQKSKSIEMIESIFDELEHRYSEND